VPTAGLEPAPAYADRLLKTAGPTFFGYTALALDRSLEYAPNDGSRKARTHASVFQVSRPRCPVVFLYFSDSPLCTSSASAGPQDRAAYRPARAFLERRGGMWWPPAA